MATDLGKAYVQIMPSSKGISGSIQKVINPEATAAGKSAGSNIASSMAKSMGNVGKTLTKSITLPVAGAATAIGGLVGALGFKRLVGLDTAQAKLKGLGYNAEEVERISGQVETAIMDGMTTMGEGVDIAAGALAAGVKEGAELERYIKLVGDAAVGANRPVDEMAQIFNRVQGGGRLMTQELNMIEMGLPGFAQAMADELAGGSLEAFREMVTNGEVGSDEFLNVMDDFAGGMAGAYSESWAGMAKNTLAYVGIIGEALLEGLFEDGKQGLANFIEVLKSEEIQQWAVDTGEKIREIGQSIAEFVKGAIEWWGGLSDGTQKFIMILGGIVVAIGPVLMIASKIAAAIPIIIGAFKILGVVIAALTSPIGLVIAAIVGAAALIFIYWEPIKEFFIGMWESIKETGLLMWESLKEGWQSAKEGLVESWESFKEFFVNLWESLKESWQNAKENLIEAWSSVKEFFSSLWTSVKETFSTIWNAIKTSVLTIVNGIKTVIMTVFNAVKAYLTTALNLYKTTFTLSWNAIKTVVTTVVNSIRTVITTVFNSIRSIISSVSSGISSVISSVWNGIRSVISSVTNSIRSTISSIFNSLSGIVRGAMSGVKTAVSSGIRGALTTVTGFISKFKDAGKNIVGAIAEGITGAISKVTDAIGNLAQKARDFLPFSPPKTGPLKDIMDVKWGETIGGGIEKGEDKVAKAMNNILSTPYNPRHQSVHASGNEDVTHLLIELIKAVKEGKNIIMNDRVVGSILEPHITETQDRNKRVRGDFA